MVAKPGRTWRRRLIDLPEVLNAIRYPVRTGCGWQMLAMGSLLLRRISH